VALQIPGLVFWIDLIAIFGIYLIIALSLNLEFGYAGISNFGKLLAVAGGAFAVGFFPGRIAAWLFGIGLEYEGGNIYKIISDVNYILGGNPTIALALFFITLVIAAIVGAVLGFLASYPAIRLREEHFAMTLLAMGEAIRIIGRNYEPLVGGPYGVRVPDPFRWAGEFRYTVSALLILGISLVVLFYLEISVRTPLGRMLRAVRDNEDVAESLGKDVTRIRMKTIIIASVIAAIGGALYAFNTSNVVSTAYTRATWTFWPWVIVIIGGAANNMGVMLGTLAFVTFRKFIIFYKELLAFVPFEVVWLDFLLLGITLILIQMYRPGGIIPEKPTSTLNSEKLEKMVSSGKAVSSSRRENSTGGSR
jgi:branched-chain amino acid transport system permease protein